MGEPNLVFPKLNSFTEQELCHAQQIQEPKCYNGQRLTIIYVWNDANSIWTKQNVPYALNDQKNGELLNPNHHDSNLWGSE